MGALSRFSFLFRGGNMYLTSKLFSHDQNGAAEMNDPACIHTQVSGAPHSWGMRKRLTSYLWRALLYVSVAFPGDAESEPLMGAVKGTVEDAATGKRIAGASVSVNLGLEIRTAVTDSAGTFTLFPIPEGIGFPVTAGKEGRRPVTVLATVSPERPAEVNLKLNDRYLKLLSFNGGRFIAGTDVEIQWEAAGAEKLRIEFSPNGGRSWILLADDVDARKNSWLWQMPDIPTENGIIRIIDPSGSGLAGRSSIPFVITST